MADGHDVETVEHLEVDGVLDPVQRGFMECHGLQCGFCTPGMLLTARALLDRDPDPSEQTIREAISGQICRCTGYATIVRSVRWAAEHAGDGLEGAATRRRCRDRPRGRARSTAGRSPVRARPDAPQGGPSPGPRSRPVHRRPPAARDAPPGDPALAAGACPDRLGRHPGRRGPPEGARGGHRRDARGQRGLAWMPTLPGDRQPVLATDKVRFQGQEVAFVVAEDRYAARDALELIDVEYDVLPPVVDSRRALDPESAGDPRRPRPARPTTSASSGRPATRPPPPRSSSGPRSPSRRRSSSPASTRRRWRPAAPWPTTTGSTSG